MAGLLTTTTCTAGDIIKLALKECGVLGIGQTPEAEDVSDAFFKLNMMIAQWQRRRWMIWHLVNMGYTSPTGVQSYTIGPGGNFPVSQRPAKIESAFFRQVIPNSPNPIDYQLTMLDSWEDYSKISLKSLSSFPQFLFYDPAYPQGVLYPWPIPGANYYELFINFTDTLNQFTSLTEVLNLPGEYVAAMFYNLAQRLAPGYGLQVNPETKLQAAEGIMTLKKATGAQVPRLSMPMELIRPGIYNVYSDQIR
jgi:hypothetical protein